LEALFSISSHLRSAQSADEMLPVVLVEMRRVLRSDANAVILLDADEEHFTYAISDGSLTANNGNQFAVENSISGLILRTRQPYTTEDFSSDPNRTADLKGEKHLGPAVFAPVISESEFIGVLLCTRAKSDDALHFAESDVQLLTAIGEMVGNALRRARLYDQALSRLQHVQTLHSIDMAISANLDLSVILEVLLTQGAAQLDVDAANILLLNPHTHMLEYAAGYGFRSKNIKSANLRLGEGLPGQAAMDRMVLHINNLPEADTLVRKHLLEEGFVSYQAAPLIAKGQLQGILEIFNRHPIEVGEEQTSFLETLATQAAIAIDNSQLFTNLQRSHFELEMAYDATIEGWSRALELRDQETEGHTLRVTDMTLQLAQNMGVRSGELTHIRRGALLHDIGKMGVPDRILLKPGKLNEKEWEIMKKHTVYAFEMLWPIEFLRPAIDIPHCHHERWDGTGYPRGLKDEQIPLSARVFAVVDVWDALTNERPYRGPWSKEDTLEYITTNSGKHFDPNVVEKFLELLKNNGIE
jgi:putative nucleotidyltransferase with HDIG domain